MKHIFTCLFRRVLPFAVGLLPLTAGAATVVTVGVGGNYLTIGWALAALPAAPTQAYELRLLDAVYTENVTVHFAGSAANTLVIKPAPGVASTIAGTFTFGSGTRYATVTGNNGGSGRNLTLVQLSQTAPAVLFAGDATNSTLRETNVLGSNASLTSGVVVIGNATATGNDNNTLTQNLIGNASTVVLPANLVYAANSAAGLNDDVTVSQNELRNFAHAGLVVDAGNGNRWTISGNSFYYDLPAVPTSAQTAIDFHPGANANDVTVTGNFIGGRAAGATGGTWANAGTQDFRGIVLACGTSTTQTNEVTNNTVSNVSLTAGGSAAALTAMDVSAGRAELNGNAATALTNTGTSGVNCLVSEATTVLNSFTVSSGQVMAVEDGLTLVTGDLTNNGILNHTGGDIVVNGNFVNAPTGTFAQTLGDTEVKGDMLNSGLFTCSTGKVKLTGNGPQLVSGGLYFNLEVNGAGVKTLTDDADVYNGVQMVQGILYTGTSRLKLGELANLSETDASYILGQVQSRRSLVASTAEDFGNLGLTLTPSAAFSPAQVTVNRYTGIAPAGQNGSRGVLRYFDLSALNANLPALTLTMTYFDHELNGIAPANLRLFQSSNNGVTWQARGRSSATANSVTLANAARPLLGRWTLGDLQAPLPVQLAAFRAEKANPTTARLLWTTAQEVNNRGFGVEVSTDGGRNFRELAFVPAQGEGNRATPTRYAYLDREANKAGTRLYRLRQEDHDGTATYSALAALNFEVTGPVLAAYPTRFASDLTVELPTNAAALRLLDLNGRIVWEAEPGSLGNGTLRVAPACAAGQYVLTATLPGGTRLSQRVERE